MGCVWLILLYVWWRWAPQRGQGDRTCVLSFFVIHMRLGSFVFLPRQSSLQ